jgi:DNA mismatch repair protein MutS
MAVREDLADMVQVEAKEAGRGGKSFPGKGRGPEAVRFHSILFEKPEESLGGDTPEAPDFFVDLNLDQIIDAITAGKQEYNLKPFFYLPLHDVDAIHYRQEVMQDLESEDLYGHITSFARRMHAMREHLAQADKLYYTYQKERWFLEAVEIYCEAVKGLVKDLRLAELKSRGLARFREYVTSYARSEAFAALETETTRLLSDLSSIRYSLLIKGNAVTVQKYESESEYSIEVERTFEKFKQGAVKDYRVKFSASHNMNHVEAAILDLLAKLYPDIFLRLDDYCARNAGYLDGTIARFDREIEFYLAFLEYRRIFVRGGLPFCYPVVSDTCKDVYDLGGFDLALADKLLREGASVVQNDFCLKGQERIFVVTGPNQGGKTTFARTFGQLHFLASLGCPVPGRKAQLFLFDGLFTHFEKEEDIRNLRGKLEDDLVRISEILEQATANSIIILNESFTATTLSDAIFLSTRVLERILRLDLLSVCVTFIDELASLSEKTVSVVAEVAPANPAVRTYRIVRRPADGVAYALSIAEKYRLTYACVKERIRG